MTSLVEFLRSLGAFAISAVIGLVVFAVSAVVLGNVLAAIFPGGDTIMVIILMLFVGLPLTGLASLALVALLNVYFQKRLGGAVKQTGK